MPMPRRPPLPLLCLLSFLAMAPLTEGVARPPARLPDLGSSADALLPPRQAELWGQAMFRQLRQMHLILDDPLLEDQLEGLGHRLAAASNRPSAHFRFFLVDDPEINAFAAPGGYIGVNSGLVLLTRNEAELASVLAHEISHVTQDHLQRSFEQARHATPLIGLALLGAVAAGAAGGGDAGIATLAGSQGLLQQRGINFTRADEVEADAVGIDTLARAGFDPGAMAAFFGRLGDQLRTDGGERSLPSLLQDHPVTTRRIAEAKAAAAALRRQHAPAPPMPAAGWDPALPPLAARLVRGPWPTLARSEDPDYGYMRERVRVLSGRQGPLDRYYRLRLRQTPVADDDAYGAGLNFSREGEADKALQWLQPLQRRHPADMFISLALAAALLQDRQRPAALALYAELARTHPERRAVNIDYARALLDHSPAEAAQAADQLRPLLAGSDDPDLYALYARSCLQAGERIRAGEADAAASYYAGRPFDAIAQFRRLLARPDLDYYARARIQAQVSQLEPLVLELRRRHIPTQDQPAGSAER